jgi:pilus assembly protein CpaC
MKSRVLATALIGSLALASPAFAQTGGTGGTTQPRAGTGAQEITLAVGEQYVLAASNIRSYSLAAEGIVDVRVPSDGSRMLVVGQRAGNTSLLVIRSDGSQATYPITVFRIPVDVVRQQVTQLVQGYNGVSINQIGGRLFLEGGVANEAQQRRVQQIAAIFPGQVESLVAVDPTIVERRINVRIDLYFVELSTNSNYVFGINWPGQILGNSNVVFNGAYSFIPMMGMSAGVTSAIATAIINQPLPRLDLASQAGWARVHRQATLVTANGNEATYHSGGEYNIRITNGLTADIRRIDFGSTMTMTPRFDPSTSRVDVRINADLSDLVDTGAEVPGRSISRVNTLVNLQLGQSIILSGMRGRSSTGGSNGLPLLAQIPILGAFFGSQSRRSRENEMVIFIVPTVIEGITRQAEDRVAAALRAYEDFGGILPGNFQENGLVPRPTERGPAPAR